MNEVHSEPGHVFIEALDIEPVFQPIVDLLVGDAIGYELLTRERRTMMTPLQLFARANELGVSWELEQACRNAALARVAAVMHREEGRLFFINVSPSVVEDQRFVDQIVPRELAAHGVATSRVVIEITETHAMSDAGRFERIMARCREQGLRFAVDDFGSGHSNLLTLITCAPRFIKLDMGIVRDVHLDAYRRHLVRALTAFAASVDARLIAEGVESWDELETLMRLGIRYAQGHLLGRPTVEPAVMSADTAERIRTLLRDARAGFGDPEETVEPIVGPAVTAPASGQSVADLDTLFRRNPAIDHVVLVDEGKPVGLVTREDLFAKIGGPYGFALHQRKAAQQVVAKPPLLVDTGASVTTLARRAMDRDMARIYDPVVVVDGEGAVVGSVTMKALIERSIELRVRTAQSANPLTGLPGNQQIQKWITRFAQIASLDVVYADLDRFKEYNDHYGFLMGDEMIRLAAGALARCLIGDRKDAFLGHVGGDDFVAVFPTGVGDDALTRSCAEFDKEKISLFEPEEIENGFLPAVNRRGELEHVPLVTLSLAVVRRSNIQGTIHPAMISQLAAALKEKVKQKAATEGRSGYIIERRFYSDGSSLRPPPPAEALETLTEIPLFDLHRKH